jgi:hypothetical protein
MKVSSPIGELPFEPRALRLKDGGLEIQGVMGAWPAHVHVTAADIPAVLRLVATPAALLGAATATVVGLVRRAGPKNRRNRQERKTTS